VNICARAVAAAAHAQCRLEAVNSVVFIVNVHITARAKRHVIAIMFINYVDNVISKLQKLCCVCA
jgi:hypothetical protein